MGSLKEDDKEQRQMGHTIGPLLSNHTFLEHTAGGNMV